uniref:Uncharacterized protein n=1 Tax=Solanum lycopersicum TaxID=4081 RepID=A0A3Q7J2B1_SOLLC
MPSKSTFDQWRTQKFFTSSSIGLLSQYDFGYKWTKMPSSITNFSS